MTIEVAPVGHVQNGMLERPAEGWEDIVSEIVVSEEYAPALCGLDDFSHIMVLCWFDRSEGERRRTLQVHPMGKNHLPRVGVFATRSPRRPNPIAVSVCRLLELEGTLLKVQGLDALDGTPVLDIKSFSARNLPVDTRHPAWLDEVVAPDSAPDEEER